MICFPVLANHYEGLLWMIPSEYKNGTPHFNDTQNICASSQQLSFIAELRPEMPWILRQDLGCSRRGCVNAICQYIWGEPEMPRSLTMDTPEKAYELHFKRLIQFIKGIIQMTWWNFVAVLSIQIKTL